MDTPKIIATVGKEPEVKALPKRTSIAQDQFGRNTPVWLPEVVGKPEGPLAVCVALPLSNARVYLSKEEALDHIEAVMAAVEEYDRQATPKA